MWPFQRKPLLDPETMDWHLDCFEWLIESYADRRRFAETRLVLPTPGFFMYDGEQGHALAERLFRQVEVYCQFPPGKIRLIPEDFVPDDQDGPLFGGIQHGRHAMATYSSGDWAAEVRYAPAMLREPLALIGTFAHELGHHLLGFGTSTPPPIAADEEEFLTDLTAVYFGFGVFLANNAFSFAQHGDSLSQGWKSSRKGYLPERDLVFDLAIFLTLKGIDPKPSMACLKSHLAGQLKRAMRDLEAQSDRLEAIRTKDAGARSRLTRDPKLAKLFVVK